MFDDNTLDFGKFNKVENKPNKVYHGKTYDPKKKIHRKMSKISKRKNRGK